VNILGGIKRIAFRVQPISHIRKREARKQGQERRNQYYAFESQLKSVRKEFGYGEEWRG
jgi:hypothetical protein